MTCMKRPSIMVISRLAKGRFENLRNLQAVRLVKVASKESEKGSSVSSALRWLYLARITGPAEVRGPWRYLLTEHYNVFYIIDHRSYALHQGVIIASPSS